MKQQHTKANDTVKDEIGDILTRKKDGIDCNEDESATIKQWLKNTTIVPGSGQQKILEDIQQLFPLEYGEALDEMEEDGIPIPAEMQEQPAPSTPLKDEGYTKGKVWRDDDGFIAIGEGDDYKTFADLDCSDLDISEREANKDRFIKCWNEFDGLKENAQLWYEQSVNYRKENEQLKEQMEAGLLLYNNQTASILRLEKENKDLMAYTEYVARIIKKKEIPMPYDAWK